MLLDSGLQIADAVPLDDGSLQTSVVDQSGRVVATVTRLMDGSAQASVDDTGGGFDWESILGKVTGFLDNVANAAKNASQQATRVGNAVRGAETGAQVGYSAPTNMTPYLVAGGAVLIVILASIGAGRHGRR